MIVERGLPSLAFLQEPAFIVRADGAIVSANGAARGIGRPTGTGARLAEWVEDPEDAVAAYLRHATGTTAPLPGALTLRTETGGRRSRTHAARLPAEDEALVVLRFLPEMDDRFAVLTRRVRELDDQLRLRLKEKAELEAALHANQTLLRELQHRVKNNIQMMLTLIKLSARGRPGADVAEVVAVAQLRLQALAASQEALYRSARPGRLDAKPMLEEVLHAASGGGMRAVAASISQADIQSETAHCLALVAAELTAATAASPEAGAPVQVAFADEEDTLSLVVSSPRPVAVDAPLPDLQLLHSLCRQLGGTLETEMERGVTYRIRVPRRPPEEAA